MVSILIICRECPDCLKLETICHRIIKERQYQGDIQKVEQEFLEQENNRLTPPVLMINEKVYSCGRVPERKEIEGWVDELLKVYYY